MNIAVFFRCLIGVLFIVSGGEKLIGPYQNFLYVVQNYELLPSVLEELTARVFPWIELLTGIFLFLGLWTKQSLFCALIMFGTFLLVVGQAIVRQLPIDECGCFGSLISLPLWGTFSFDAVMFLIGWALLRNMDRTSTLSVDRALDPT